MARLIALVLLLAIASVCRAQIVRVFPESPFEGEPFVIEVVAPTPTPQTALGNSSYVFMANIFLDLSLTSTGAATPGTVRFTKMMPGNLHSGIYQLVVTVHPEGAPSGAPMVLAVPITARATPAQPAFRNLSGLWFSPDESGWGVSIVQGVTGQLFAMWFTYRPSDSAPTEGREAYWLHLPAGIWASPTEFRGLLFETFGTNASKPFDPTQLTVNGAGDASFRFLSDDEAEFTAHAGTLDSPFFQKKKVLRRFAF